MLSKNPPPIRLPASQLNIYLYVENEWASAASKHVSTISTSSNARVCVCSMPITWCLYGKFVWMMAKCTIFEWLCVRPCPFRLSDQFSITLNVYILIIMVTNGFWIYDGPNTEEGSQRINGKNGDETNNKHAKNVDEIFVDLCIEHTRLWWFEFPDRKCQSKFESSYLFKYEN